MLLRPFWALGLVTLVWEMVLLLVMVIEGIYRKPQKTRFWVPAPPELRTLCWKLLEKKTGFARESKPEPQVRGH